MKNNFAVVGAGIAGIFAALQIKHMRPGSNVVLIEQSECIGGLLASKKFKGMDFDFGTHVPRSTGHKDIDALLFGELDANEWRYFNDINAANVSYNNTLYTRSASPYIGPKNNSQHQQSMAQLMEAKNRPAIKTSNLKQQLIELYGADYVNRFFAPCIAKKLGVSIDELAPDTHRLIGLGRIIVDDAKAMRALKKDKTLDQILAFADQTEGMSPLTNMYPKNGKGIGLWIESLSQSLKDAGVIVKTRCSVTEIMHQEGKVNHIWLSDGSEYTIEHLCWSSPSFALIHAARLRFQSEYRPIIRQTHLYHFAFEKPFLIDSNYVDINDPQFDSFRVTLYPNLSDQHSGPYKCTVEHIEPQNEANSPSRQEILQELRAMGIVAFDNLCTLAEEDIVKAGFPIITPAFHKEVKRQQSAISSQLSNVTCLGKAHGNAFFMQDILIDAHNQLETLFALEASHESPNMDNPNVESPNIDKTSSKC